MARLLSRTFKSLKPHSVSFRPKPLPKSTPSKLKLSPSSSTSSPEASSKSRLKSKNPWLVYLILSTNHPIKTYVGVTNNFSRRLKQHNGELSGGAKASRVGRPWVCACLINGFSDRSEACQFESKWKYFSKKLSRRRVTTELEKQAEDDGSFPLLQHRRAALKLVQSSVVCSHLEIDWHFNLS